jgi:hypothetical protein
LVIVNAPEHGMSFMLDDGVLGVTLVLPLDRMHTDKEETVSKRIEKKS